ncbi:MAG: vitamin K epoxide reductase family protein [Bacteroidota bacterium]
MSKTVELTETISNFLKKNRVTFDQDQFSFELRSHPDFPQLIAVVDTLDYLNIDHDLYEASIEEIDDSVTSFLTLLDNDQGPAEINVVRKKKNVFYTSNSKYTEAELRKRWKNIVLLVNKPTGVINAQNTQLKPLILFLVYAAAVVFSANFELVPIAFTLLPFAGLLFCVTALKDLFSLSPKLTKKVCEINKSTGCESVIGSKKWRIFQFLDFSDLGFTFFITQLITFLLFGLTSNLSSYFSLQLILVSLSAPVVLASLYYQKQVEKKWCPICLSIILIVISEFFFLRFLQGADYTTGYQPAIFYGIIFTTIVIGWKAYRKTKEKNNSLVAESISSKATLREYPLFRNLLTSGPMLVSESESITFFSDPKKNTITLITDPYCDHCRETHQTIDKLFGDYHGYFNWNTIFNVEVDDEPYLDKRVYRLITSLQLNEDQEMTSQAISEWFMNEDEEQWIEKYQHDYDTRAIDDHLMNQYHWMQSIQLNYTPIILINGYKLPELYQVEDLRFFIEYLIEDFNQ